MLLCAQIPCVILLIQMELPIISDDFCKNGNTIASGSRESSKNLASEFLGVFAVFISTVVAHRRCGFLRCEQLLYAAVHR